MQSKDLKLGQGVEPMGVHQNSTQFLQKSNESSKESKGEMSALQGTFISTSDLIGNPRKTYEPGERTRLTEDQGTQDVKPFTALERLGMLLEVTLDRFTAGHLSASGAEKRAQEAVDKERGLLEEARVSAEAVIRSFDPHRIIPRPGDATKYLQRWYLKAPRRDKLPWDDYNLDARSFGWYLHLFTDTYQPEIPHDHPWNSIAIQLSGGIKEELYSKRELERDDIWDYKDVVESGNRKNPSKFVRQTQIGTVSVRTPDTIHSITDVDARPITLFITGAWRRPWFFYPRENGYKPVINTIWRKMYASLEG